MNERRPNWRLEYSIRASGIFMIDDHHDFHAKDRTAAHNYAAQYISDENQRSEKTKYSHEGLRPLLPKQ